MIAFLCSRLVGRLKMCLLVVCVASATGLGPIAQFVLKEYSRSVNRSASTGGSHLSVSLASPSNAQAAAIVESARQISGVLDVAPVLRLRLALSAKPFDPAPGDHSISKLTVDCVGLEREAWPTAPFDYDEGRGFLENTLLPPLVMMGKADEPNLVLMPEVLLGKIVKRPAPSADSVLLTGELPDGAPLHELCVSTAGVFKAGVFSSGEERTLEMGWRLTELRKFTGSTQELNAVELRLRDPHDVNHIASLLRRQLPAGATIVTWREREHDSLNVMLAIEVFVDALLLLFMGVALLAVYTAVRMIFDDRLAEFGTLKALGCSTRTLMKVLFRLGGAIGGYGALAGGLVGCVAATFARNHLLTLMKMTSYSGKYEIVLNSFFYGLQAWFAVAIVVFLAGLPIMKLQPATLLRDE